MFDEQFNWEKSVYRDKLGRQIESDELEILLRDKEYKIVAQEMVGKYFVSTVWLGVPYDMGASYFETMIFESGKPVGDKVKDCYRYANLPQAEKGHKEAVSEWNKIVKEESKK